MTRYFVVENTPGYLSEDEGGFDGYENVDDAKRELRGIVDQWCEGLAERGATADVGISEDGLSAWMDNRSDYTYDLGRIAQVVEMEGDAS